MTEIYGARCTSTAVNWCGTKLRNSESTGTDILVAFISDSVGFAGPDTADDDDDIERLKTRCTCD